MTDKDIRTLFSRRYSVRLAEELRFKDRLEGVEDGRKEKHSDV